MPEERPEFRIALITHAFHHTLVGETILHRFITILEPITEQLYVITGTYGQPAAPHVHVMQVQSDDKKESSLIRLLKYIFKQFQIMRQLVKVSNHIDITIFFIGTGTFAVPVLLSRILGKRTFIIATESMREVLRKDSNRISWTGRLILPPMARMLEMIVFQASHGVIIYSPTLIPQLGLERYRNKILISQDHYIDFRKFRIQKPFQEREAVIGYVGRLSGEKGVMNFIKALPEVFSAYPQYRAIIVGDGPLRKDIEKFIQGHDLDDRVSLIGWIKNEHLPRCLNELRLLVIPSYTETGPIIALEAMGCGTPVLGTKVGYILQMIQEGVTGFHLTSNNPHQIAVSVIRVLGDPHLDEIGLNGHSLAEERFRYDHIVDNYRQILRQ
jgi:glycosyltransferase involved in cell wall biosynthesis